MTELSLTKTRKKRVTGYLTVDSDIFIKVIPLLPNETRVKVSITHRKKEMLKIEII